MSTLTCTIGVTAYLIADNAIAVSGKPDARSTCSFTLLDPAGTATFSKAQPVLVSDSVLGELFGGYIHAGVATNIYPNTLRSWAIDLVDMVWLCDKRTSNSLYNNQYAGVIFCDQVQTILSAEGVTMQAALDYNHLQSDWTSGGATLTNVTAATSAGDGNAGDGDLELAPAGVDVTFSDDFSTGTFSNTQLDANGNLTLATTQAIMLSGQAVQGAMGGTSANSYVYIEFWKGSSAISAGDALQYDVWISSTSPAQMAGVDGICGSNGQTIRNFSPTLVDQQGLAADPDTDLSGFATDQWYTRTIDLTPMAGKTLTIMSVALQSNANGFSTAYFRKIKQIITSSGLARTTFFGASGTLATYAVNSLSNYTNAHMSQVVAYEMSGYRQCPTVAIGPVGIVQTSNIDWDAPVVSTVAVTGGVTQTAASKNATLPTLTVQTSIDNGATWQPATQYGQVPNLLPGMSVGSANLLIQEVFTMAGPDPTLSPTLVGLQTVIQTSYNATKTDVIQTEMTQTDWNLGTTTHLTANLDNTLTLNQAGRNWAVTNSIADQTLYGSSTPKQSVQAGELFLSCHAGSASDVRSRLDFAGTWTDFTAELDINYGAAIPFTTVGFTYRTTNWNNNTDSFGYHIWYTPGSLNLSHGTNGGSGPAVQLKSTAVTLSTGTIHRLKVVVSGNNHQAFIDDVQYININDGTYSAAGYIALLFYNNAPDGLTHSCLYDNFGITHYLSGTYQTVSKSLAPALTVGNSLIAWQQAYDPSGLTSLVVSTSIDGGSTWAVCTNGGLIPQLTTGLSLTGKSLLIQVVFTTPTANFTPVLSGLTAWVVGGFLATGTWTSPALSLAAAQTVGSSAVNWNVNEPSGGCTLSVKTSVDGGATYQNVSTPGNPIANLIAQPNPTVDIFNVNTSANYSQTFLTGGGAATFTWDTANLRLLATQTTSEDAVLETNGLSYSDMIVSGDFNYCDSGGLVARMINAGHAYVLAIADASAASNANTAKLYTIGGGSGGGGFVPPTPLTVYGSTVAATTLPNAGLLALSIGGVDSTTSTALGTATGYGEITALGTAGATSATDSPYGSVFYVEGGNTPSTFPQKLIDLLVGGNGEPGMVPGGPVWCRIQQRWINIEQTPGVYTWTWMDDAVSRCNAAHILVDATIQTPPVWRCTIDYMGNSVPVDGTTYIGTLGTAIVNGTTYTHVILTALTAGQTLVTGQQIALEYGALHQENVLVAGGSYASGATSITVTNLDGTPWVAAHNHAAGVLTENAGGIFASGADTLTFVKQLIARYNGTTTNYLTTLSQPAQLISALQHNEDYDLFGTNLQRDLAPQAFVKMWQIVAPEVRTHHPTCRLIGPALRFVASDDGSGGTFGLNHMTSWTNTLFTYFPAGKWAGCISDGASGTLLDALDFHYYRIGSTYPDHDPYDQYPTGVGTIWPSVAQELLALKAVATANGYPNFDIWCTETGWDVYDASLGGTTLTSSFQQQADFFCGPSNSGNLTGHPGTYEMHRLNGGSHVFIWTIAPNAKAYTYTTPPWSLTSKGVVMNIWSTSGGPGVFTKLPAYLATVVYAAAYPKWGSPWASGGSLPAPTGNGWLLDSSVLATQKINLGNWSPILTLGGAAMTATFYVRAYAYDTSALTYTAIGQAVLTGKVLTTAKTAVTVPATSFAAFTFNATQRLYIDCMANVTANSGTSATMINSHLSSSGSVGVASDMQVGTPGYVSSTLGAAIAVNLATLSYTAVAGSSPAAQVVQLSNTGTASGTWTEAIVYTSGTPGWLSLAPTTSVLGIGANVNVTCTVASTGLAVGTYTATVTWTLGTTTATTMVTLTITSATSKITAAPTSLAFAATIGSGSPATQNVVLTNSDTSSHPWSEAIVYTGGTPGWLSLSPTSGTLTASGGTGTIVATATLGVLVAGTYTATITWTMTTSTATTTVVFTVSPAPGNLLNTLLGSVAIAFTRNSYHRFILSTIGSTITASMDGVQLLSVTDSTVSGAGGAGVLVGQNTGDKIQCYQFRVQPQGQNVASVSVRTRLTLTSTDPLNSPQVLDEATFVGGPTIGLGVLVPAVNYQGTYVSSNFDDLKTKSNYWWNILNSKQAVFSAQNAVPAPWILQASDAANTNILLAPPPAVTYSGDLYRNRQTLLNVHATSLQPQLFIGDGTSTSWTLTYPVATGTVPLVVLDGIIQSVGIAGIDTGKSFYYSVGSKAITQDRSQTVLTGLDTLVVTYTGSYLTTVVRNNTGGFPGTVSQAQYAAIDGTSGIVEAVEDLSQDIATASMSVAQAIVYGDGLLQRFGIIGRTIVCKTQKPGLQPGQLASVFLPQHQIFNMQALITQVDISAQIGGPNGILYFFTITATEGSNLSSWEKLFNDVFNN